MRKIDLVYDGADSITLNWFNEVLYKLRYYSINLNRKKFFLFKISFIFGIDEKSYLYVFEPTLLRYVIALKKTLAYLITYLKECYSPERP